MCLRDTEVRFRTVSAPGMNFRAYRFGRIFALFTGIVVFGTFGQAQVSGPSLTVGTGAAGKGVAGTTVDEGLAGAASGPVVAVWYAPGTGRLLVETESSRVFETPDFVHWRLNTDATAPARNAGAANAAELPEAGAKVQAAGARLYAAGPSNVYASDDGGRTWLNLTGYNTRSVIGDGFTALATAPG